jgi:hypothetical protein
VIIDHGTNLSKFISIYTCLNMVIWSNIYKDALILDELCMYIKNIVLLIRKIWYTRKHIFTLLNLWDIWKGQKNVTCKNLLCSGLLDSSRTWVLSLPNNLILPSLQNKIKNQENTIVVVTLRNVYITKLTSIIEMN